MTSLLAPPTPTPSRTKGAVAGLLAAAAALASGELLAGIFPFFASPFLTVAEKFIDLTPQPLKQFAIDTFGQNDKIALIVGAFVVIVILGIVLGILARTRPVVGYVGITLLGIVALLAAITGVPGLVGGLPALVAIPAGIAVLALLLRTASGSMERVGADGEGSDRRSFLAMTGMTALAAAAAAGGGRLLGNRFTATASRAAVTLPNPADAAPAVPTGAAFDQAVPFITPMDEFYRVDTALSIPQVRAEDFNLRIFGMVDNELNLSYDDLVGRDLVERTITLTCVSNPVGGDLIGTATWKGVLLADLLEEAGVQSDATQVVGRSVDDYTCGFPVEKALDGRDAMVVVGMNDEVLPLERGFPARLLVPGLYGYVSATKWLSEIELTTFEAFDQYWVPRGWDETAPIKISSRIDSPRGATETSVEPGDVTIAGVAWAQPVGVAKVEIRIDGGDWQECELAEAVSDDTWRQWRFPTSFSEPGLHSLTVRATDNEGNLQTEDRAEPFPNGASGWMTLRIRVA